MYHIETSVREEIFMNKFSNRLKERRLEKKLTQQALADKVGVNRVTYTNWENGNREPDLDKVVELATELNTTIDYLLGTTDENALDWSAEKIKQANPEELQIVVENLKKNLQSIFDIGKAKFDISEDEMEIIKFQILKEFLDKQKEK